MEERVQNIYQCAICLKEFSRKSTCKSHMKLHTGERPYECETCGVTFASKSNLNTHVLTHTHQKCPTCGKTFTSKPLLKSHMIMHTSERPHECNLCGKRFKRKGELRSHMVTHTGEKRWKCQLCGNLFTERHSLKVHMRLHTGEKPYKCSVCEKTFSRKSSYNSHSRMHTGVQPYKCFVCGKKFAHRSVMVSHSKKHMIRECGMCGMNFMKENELTTHIREAHKDDWPYRCNICGRTFSDNAKVRRHMRLHTESKPFRCDICSRQFLQNSALQNHMLSHEECEARPKCEVCGKTYSAKLSLEVHMRTHTGVKPFMCSMCGKTFTRKSGCVSHMRMHTGERPYSCDICGKNFAYASGMRNHMKHHTRIECNLCGIKIIGGINPNDHVTSVIVPSGAKCTLCDIEFKSLSLFKCHLNKHDVSERQEICRKNSEMLGIALGETDMSNEEEPLHVTELPVLLETEEPIDKKMSLPEVAMLEAFPNQEDLILSPLTKTVGAKKARSPITTLMKVKQENVEMEDQEFFDTAVLEVTKGADTLVVSANDMEGPCPPQNFESHSQEIEFNTSPPVSPLRDIDSLPSTLSPSALSNPPSPTPKIAELVPTIGTSGVDEISFVSISGSSDKEFSSEDLDNTSKVITINTSSPSKAPTMSLGTGCESITISTGTSSHTISPSKIPILNPEVSNESITLSTSSHTITIPKTKTPPSIEKPTCSAKITKTSPIAPKKVYVKAIKRNCYVSPVFKIMAGRSKKVSDSEKRMQEVINVKPLRDTNTLQDSKVKSLLTDNEKSKSGQSSVKSSDSEGLDLPNTYSAYVKKMLTLIKPVDKQMALVKALNNTMDDFIEKYQSWR